MHEATRRWICRVGFLFCCLLPTAAVTAWAVATHSARFAEHRRSVWCARLSAYLGLDVDLDRADVPRPDTVVLRDLVIREPESGRRVALVRRLRIRTTDGKRLFVLSDAEVQPQQLARLGELFHDRVMRVARGLKAQVNVAHVTVHHVAGSQVFHDVRAFVDPSEHGLRAALEFRPHGSTEAAHLILERLRHQLPAVTRYEFQSPTPLPCTLLDQRLAPWGQLGDHCRFAGSARLEKTEHGWRGSLNGTLTEVELDRLVTERLPHRLSGKADVDVRPLTFARSRLLQMAGSVRCQGGEIGTDLLGQTARHLECIADSRGIHSEVAAIPFRELAAEFELDARGIQLRGQCEHPSGAVLVDRQGPLLWGTRRRVPIAALVQALVPPTGEQVPATAEARALLQSLPVPELRLADREADSAGD